MNSRQYTIRNVPGNVVRELRRRAQQERKSLNAVIIEMLQEVCGLKREPRMYHDLDLLIGTWVEDAEFDEVIEDFERIDTEAWK